MEEKNESFINEQNSNTEKTFTAGAFTQARIEQEENRSAESTAAPAPVPPQSRYTYYSDGSRRYTSAEGAYTGYTPNGSPYCGTPVRHSPPPPKKSVATIVLASLVAVLLVACIGLGIWFLLGELKEDANDNGQGAGASEVLADDSDTKNKGNAQKENEVASVPERVTVTPTPDDSNVNPIPEENFDSLVELYDHCAPACVSILCTVEYNNGFYVQEGVSLGSGFVVANTLEGDDKSDYYIITNHHVIENAKSIEVKFYDDSTYTATLVGSDEMTDIAVLTIEKEDLVALDIGDSNSLKVGEWVIAIGTPSDEEFAGTMSYGIVSGINRELQITNSYGTVVKTMTVIQTTATLNPGNSGGPLINMEGKVVGINAMKLSEEYEGMGFALPSTSAINIINSLIEHGKVVDRTDSFVVSAAQLGITGTSVTEDIIDAYNLSDDCPHGVLVTNVSRGTAVYEAGLNIYDIITEFNGVKIETIEELQAELKKSNAGTEVSMTFYRLPRRNEEGGYHTINFVLDSAN